MTMLDDRDQLLATVLRECAAKNHQIARLEAALEVAKEFIDDQVDVVDGDYGVPAPNRAMQTMTEINEIMGLLP